MKILDAAQCYIASGNYWNAVIVLENDKNKIAQSEM